MEQVAWWGGVFERMIECMNHCLRKTMGRATLTYEEFLIEIELVLNLIPILIVSPNDYEEPLRPSHLLTRCRILGLPENIIEQTLILI
jgi:hypothetical protein